MPVKLFAPCFAALLLVLSGSASWGQDDGTLARRAKRLLASQCSNCHAIGPSDESPHRAAPPLRTLGQRYSIEGLAEAFAEGLATGHADMPEFIFAIEDVGAILAYLNSIQDPTAANRRSK